MPTGSSIINRERVRMIDRRRNNETTLEDVARNVERLARYVEKLDSTLHLRAGRITPYPGEVTGGNREPYSWEKKKEPTLADIYELTRSMDQHIKGMEVDTGAMRAKLDQIEDDIHPRKDFKRWLRRDD